jgi:RND family efflux transporter MFP subunit
MGKAGAASDQQVDEKTGAWEEARASHDAGQSAVSQAEAQLAAAQADEAAARADVHAAREAVNASASSLEADTAAIEAALAAQDASSFNSQRSSTLSDFERIEAPFDGVIIDRNIEVGSLVSGGTAAAEHGTGLFTIAHIEKLKAVAEVPESAAPYITLGMDVTVEVRDLDGDVLKGKVWRRSGALNQSSRTLHVEVLLDNPGKRAEPGLYCRMHFDVPSVAWTLPSTSLRVGAEGTQVVEVLPDGKVRAVNVKVSRDLGKEIELVYKFTGKENILSDPPPTLRDGTSVEAKLKASPSP